ncbi:MAG TPA: metallophosphoesterase [Phycisphaerae bacterium]|nr:metallophosphoesterase [Phycisphaerae bacterium]
MRIIVTSDLHYDVARSRTPTESIAREICERGGDVLLVVGDTASNLPVLERGLGLFDNFGGCKLMVAGNHELWTAPGEDSLHRYENELDEACSRNGFQFLDSKPFVEDGLAIVGSVGWYDYSFRPSLMKIPLRFFQSKVAPGAAARMDEWQHLVERGDDLCEAAMQVTTRWMDGVRVKLPMTDAAFTEYLADKLRSHLDTVVGKATRTLAAIHHLPFAEMVPHSPIPDWEFATAYHGAELFGEVLLDYPQVSHVFSGHCHRERRLRKRHLNCMSIGSTYTAKRYEVLDV